MSEVLIVMGVTGSGKSTVGRHLADRLSWEFLDADDFHSPQNLHKLESGVPLDDEDRLPWLRALRRVVVGHLAAGRPLVLACSALKARYREILQDGDPRVEFLFLRGDREVIARRLAGRSGHFMAPALLLSQLEALEEPAGAVVVDIDQSVDGIVADALELLGMSAGG